MKLTLLDTKTRIREEIDSCFDAKWWAEGNGSCDCNRAIEMDCEEDMEDSESFGYCSGAKRFLIIKASSDEFTLVEFNRHYTDELVKRFIKGD